MAITKQTKPYEFLARWDHQTGVFKGAHIQQYEGVYEDGTLLTGNPGKAMGVGEGLAFPLAEILSQLQIDTLAANAALQATITAHEATIAARDATIAARDATITALESQLAPTPVLLPVGAFISRFTDEEFIAVRALAQTDATAAGFVARTAQPEPINLASPLFQAAMKYLVAKKVIAADRVAALGAAPEAQA